MANRKSASEAPELNYTPPDRETGLAPKPDGDFIWLIPCYLIDEAHYNPRNPKKPHLQRDSTQGKHVKALARSIQKFGQLVPALVTRLASGRWLLHDGHCRLAALNLLQSPYMRCIEADPAHLPAQVYETVNSCSKKHAPNELLLTWLVDPLAVSPKCQGNFRRMVDHIGLSPVEKLARAGMTYATYTQSVNLARRVGLPEDRQTVVTVLEWVMRYEATRKVRQGLDNDPRGHFARAVKAAIRHGIPLED